MSPIRRWLKAGAVGLALGLACKDGTGPVAGTLQLQLTVPPANVGADGAIKLVLGGPAPTSVTPAAGLALWSSAFTGTTDTVVVTGTLPAGTVLTLAVTDNRPSRYSAQILEVAAGGTFQLRSLSGYALTVVR
ncbi:MAG: hypothetical protein ACREL9_14660 [Gemmatimonadales bacterium]